jgi:hypothetical protein
MHYYFVVDYALYDGGDPIYIKIWIYPETETSNHNKQFPEVGAARLVESVLLDLLSKGWTNYSVLLRTPYTADRFTGLASIDFGSKSIM